MNQGKRPNKGGVICLPGTDEREPESYQPIQVLVALPFGPRDGRLTEAEISARFDSPITANSAAEFFQKAGLQLRGEYTDVDGVRRELQIPVLDKESTTIDGMTAADEGLRTMYVRLDLAEQLARTPTENLPSDSDIDAILQAALDMLGEKVTEEEA